MALRWLLLAALVACGGKRHKATNTDIAIVDVTVVPMDREGELQHQTVIVRDGKIAAPGPIASTKVADGATRIDGRGKWLIPGLADMHAHTFDPRQLALFATEGITQIRVMWGFPATLGVRNAIIDGEARLAPSIVTAGSIIDGDPP